MHSATGVVFARAKPSHSETFDPFSCPRNQSFFSRRSLLDMPLSVPLSDLRGTSGTRVMTPPFSTICRHWLGTRWSVSLTALGITIWNIGEIIVVAIVKLFTHS